MPQDRFYDVYLERLTSAVRALRVGPGLAPGTQMGPLVDGAQLDAVLTAVGWAPSEGARVVVGGERLTGAEYARGFFMAPTVRDDATPTMACIMQEEIFDPIVALSRTKPGPW